jgi:hypothetical protein
MVLIAVEGGPVVGELALEACNKLWIDMLAWACGPYESAVAEVYEAYVPS